MSCGNHNLCVLCSSLLLVLLLSLLFFIYFFPVFLISWEKTKKVKDTTRTFSIPVYDVYDFVPIKKLMI